MRQVLGHLTYSRVVSTLALFIALGGGAYAISLGKNSVGSKQIREGAVRSAEIKDKAVKGRDIAPNTIGGGKIKNDSLGLADIDEAEVFEGISAAASKGGGFTVCDPTAAILIPCESVELVTPTAGKILATASGAMISSGTGGGGCDLTVDDNPVGRVDNTPTQTSTPFTLVGVSQSVSPGPHTIRLRCSESSAQFHVQVFGLTATLAAAPYLSAP